MKYYLVNFLVFSNHLITENNTMALSIAMDAYDTTAAFKKQILQQRKYGADSSSIVIKTYKQISEDIFQLVHPFIKENPIPCQQSMEYSPISYQYNTTTYSK